MTSHLPASYHLPRQLVHDDIPRGVATDWQADAARQAAYEVKAAHPGWTYADVARHLGFATAQRARTAAHAWRQRHGLDPV